MTNPDKQHYSFDLLTDYVEGKLTTEKNNLIQAHVQDCEICAGVLEGIQFFYAEKSKQRTDLDSYLNDFQEEQEELIELSYDAEVGTDEAESTNNVTPKKEAIIRSIGDDQSTNERQATNQAATGSWRRWLAIAAMVIVLLGVGLFLQMQNSSGNTAQLADNYLEKSFYNPTSTRGDNNNTAAWTQAVEAWQKKEFKKASQVLEPLAQAATITQEQEYFLALSYLYQNPAQTDKAIPILQKLQASNGRFQQQADWFLSLALVQKEDIKAAKTQLQQIIDQKGWKAKQASELIRAL